LLDDLNRRLLRELHADPRISMSALARRVGMSAPAVTERVQRMERAGVITGYRMEVSAAALGLPVTAFARIRPAAGQLPRIAELAAELPEVSECHRITGEDCFLVKIHAAAIEDLEATLDRFLLYGQTVSSIVVSSPVPPRPLPVPDGLGRQLLRGPANGEAVEGVAECVDGGLDEVVADDLGCLSLGRAYQRLGDLRDLGGLGKGDLLGQGEQHRF
jgi:Lrp/AsnC family leucine-responsive transcriptional regulator